LITIIDIKASIEFYQLLGFKHIETIQRPNDQLVVMSKDNLKLELMKLPSGTETYRLPRINSDVGFRHIGFKVDDIQEIYVRLKDKIKFDSPPEISAGRGDRKILFFKDPNGIELHFIQD
jgi:catechol 2,3-dioxygenase-like lactoylglutathione lyase family enzyme